MLISLRNMVTREAWAQFVQEVKTQCIQAMLQLINEFDKRFHAQEVLNAMGIIYPQYWL
jgi:hypothetical protein